MNRPKRLGIDKAQFCELSMTAESQRQETAFVHLFTPSQDLHKPQVCPASQAGHFFLNPQSFADLRQDRRWRATTSWQEMTAVSA